MGMYVDMVFADPGAMAGKTAVLGAWMFSLQIYCDFSAYMDMAVGCGRMFGIELSRNFNFPYMARSIGDFWRRWHITLTSWFRDYVYIPLGGNQVGDRKWVRNILAVFLLSGLWHGAAWTFVFWGGLHGAFYLAGRYTGRIRDRVRRAVRLSGNPAAVWQVMVTFQLVSLAWVFFRAETIGGAFSLIRNMFVQWDLPVRMMASQFSTALAFAAAVGFIGIEVVSFWAAKKQIDVVGAMPAVIRYPGYAVLLMGISLLGVSSNQFIYFQF
jgi:alginate O-acetyltransferase complex protein AlgI